MPVADHTSAVTPHGTSKLHSGAIKNPLIAILKVAVMAQLAPLVVPALKKHTATVIWAHGLGDSAFNDLAQQQDQPGIYKSRDYFHSLIKAEVDKGIPSSRIVLGGFSQGGSISIFAGLTSPFPLAGIFGLSSYLLLGNTLPSLLTPEIRAANSSTPIFMGHGDVDPLVKLEWGQETAKTLKGLGWKVDFNVYRNLAHSADPQEMDDLEKWLGDRLPTQG
ncbi:MAG: hypothetical protein Q9184_004775 [Pyrenodesmia sp. 2 TL-2023]